MAGFGEVQEQYTKDLERDSKQARKEINELQRQLAEAREQLRVYESNDEFMRKVIRKSITPQMYGFSCEEVIEILHEKRLDQLKEKGE